MTLFETGHAIGGQFDLARRIPGKEEFSETIRHYTRMLDKLSGVNYERVDDDGLHISFGSDRSDARILAVDNVVVCAGQDSVRDLEDGLRRAGIEPHVIGGAALAAELDAKRAIRQGTELSARL